MVENRPITFAHFTFNGGKELAFPGVERVIHTQALELHCRGNVVRLLVGATDIPEGLLPYALIVREQLRSGFYSLLEEGREISEENVREVLNVISEVVQGGFLVAHNTTNAARHNPPFGAAVARWVEEEGVDNTIIWVHDARKMKPPHAEFFLPNAQGAKLAVVSRVREKQLLRIIEKARKNGIALPDFNIRVIPNPIDRQFFNPNPPEPSGLIELARQFLDLKELNNLELLRLVERLLFNDKEDVFKVVVPARVAEQKGIIESLNICKAYSQEFGQRVLFIVSGRLDMRKPENVECFKEVVQAFRDFVNENLIPVILNGVDWRFMPWLYRKADLVLCYFRNEGFGIPPVEAAVAGARAIVISEDPALMETTEGNALALPSGIDFRTAAHEIHGYLSSNNPEVHKRELTKIASQRYTVEVAVNQLLEFLTLS